MSIERIGSIFLVFLTALSLCLVSGFLPIREDSIISPTSSVPHSIAQAKIEHAPVLIISESDFATLGFSGAGSLEDPYVIDNLWIHGSHSYGISISNIDAYVTIRNVRVELDDGFSLFFRDCLSIVLQDVDVIGGWEGVSALDCTSLNMTD
ncbi:MAG: hypothetical protein ACFFDR_01955, partial [Candidatus Thorarchaeota archaeon]